MPATPLALVEDHDVAVDAFGIAEDSEARAARREIQNAGVGKETSVGAEELCRPKPRSPPRLIPSLAQNTCRSFACH